MSTWTEGYVTDLLYTYGYYSELNPLNAKLLLLSSGIACPEKFETACELGFGQGMSINIHAAASDTVWYGTDLNPAQAGFAQSLAQRSGIKVNLFDDSFEDFISNPQVPMLDFIGIHGIWSWISDEARASIIKFIQKKLKVGGVVYCSYNVLPGFLSLLPVRHLLKRHFDLMGSGHGTEQAVEDSLQFVKGIMDSGARYGVQVPAAKQRFNEILKQNRHYLAHEYYNEHWDLMHFDEIEKIFSEAKAQFAVSAVPSDSVDIINYTQDQLKILNAIEDRSLKQTVGDFIKNQQFRRDYYVKGLRFLDPTEQQRRLLELKVLLRAESKGFVYKTSSILGEVSLKEEIYRPIVEFLGDNKVHSLGQIAQNCKQIPLSAIVSAVLMLSGKGDLIAARDADAETQRRCKNLNNEIIKYAEGRGEITFLSSPVSGGGIYVSVLDQIMLQSLLNGGKEDAQSLGAYLKDNLIRRRVGLNLKGKAVSPESEEGQSEIAKLSQAFALKIKQLKALQIIPSKK